jgi:hypothetical protein
MADINNIYTTKHWRELRASILDDHNCVCAICNKKRWLYLSRKDEWRIQGRWATHHLTYERAGGAELPEDVVPLCYMHHQMIHLIMDTKSDAPIIRALQVVLEQALLRPPLALTSHTEDTGNERGNDSRGS